MTSTTEARPRTGQGLNRSFGFWGLTFTSLGSVIGSGWLLGALTAATLAGGGSLLSWLLAIVMLGVLALIHADLGAAYPVSGGTTRYPHFAFGSFAGFTAGWTVYLQSVAISPLEVEASLGYLNTLPGIRHGFDLQNSNGTLTLRGFIIAFLALVLFAAINALGSQALSRSVIGVVAWKIFVPTLTIVVLGVIMFRPGNFTAGGGFLPYGMHGVFAALPAGVVFSLQGFEQASQLAGEAKNPRKDLAKAILTAMGIGGLLYLLLEVVFIGGLNPANIAHGWKHPIGAGDFGPYYTLAIGAGVGWLAVILIVDAVISPGGTGLIYVGTSSRIAYALGAIPALRRVSKRGVPLVSVVVSAALGVVFLAPSPNWQQLVNVITSATAVMYGLGPISLAALNRSDPDREHPYRVPLPAITLPVGFAFASLIIYWGSFAIAWKLGIMIAAGQVVYLVASAAKVRTIDAKRAGWRSAIWLWIWLGGLIVISALGQYGGARVIPDGIDAAIVAAFALAVFALALRLRLPESDAAALLDADDELRSAAQTGGKERSGRETQTAGSR